MAGLNEALLPGRLGARLLRTAPGASRYHGDWREHSLSADCGLLARAAGKAGAGSGRVQAAGRLAASPDNPAVTTWV